MAENINTPEGLLKHLLYRNPEGVWFVRIGEKMASLPRWLWPHCELATKEPPSNS